MVDSVLKSETKSTYLRFAVPNAYLTNKFLITYDAFYYVEHLALLSMLFKSIFRV